MSSNKLLGILAGVVGVLIIAVVVVSIAVISHSGSNKSGTNSSNTASAASKANAGQALRIPGDDPLTLDPALVFDVTSSQYVVELYGGLVTLDQSLKVQPDIAKSWDVSPDGKTYTFHLRGDVVFSGSNRKVTAQDFKYSMERACNQKTDSPTADTYLGDIVGCKDMVRGQASSASGIKVIDDQTLELDIDAAKPYFLAKLTYPTAFVVDKDQIASDARNWTRHPHGTGPFILKQWNIGQNLTLVPNPRYHLGVPQLKEVDFSLAGGSALTQYQNGEIDIDPGVGVDDIESVRDPNNPINKEFHEQPDLSTGYIAFNAQQPPFDDPKVRQAFSESVDKNQLVNTILKGEADVANGILPPGLPGYSKETKGLPYDPTAAKQLLAQSKYAGKLPPIQLSTAGTGANVGPLIEALVQMWKTNLGVDVTVQQVEAATFLQNAVQGKFQMWEAGWAADYPDPEDFLSVNFSSQSQQNDTKYNNPEVDKLLQQADTTLDQTQRMTLYHQAEQQIINDAAWLPLVYDKEEVLIKPYVKGYALVGMIIPILRYVSIQK
jgi:oligopeptide transport system substrate-binding protein